MLQFYFFKNACALELIALSENCISNGNEFLSCSFVYVFHIHWWDFFLYKSYLTRKLKKLRSWTNYIYMISKGQ